MFRGEDRRVGKGLELSEPKGTQSAKTSWGQSLKAGSPPLRQEGELKVGAGQTAEFALTGIANGASSQGVSPRLQTLRNVGGIGAVGSSGPGFEFWVCLPPPLSMLSV